MTQTEIRAVEAAIGYHFQNPALLKQAFTRSSYVNEMAAGHKTVDTQSNEVLEFFGDSVLSAALAYLLLQKYGKVTNRGLETHLTEKDYSIIKSNMSDKKALAQAIRELGIGRYMRLSRGDMNQNVLEQDSPNEDLFESIIAAVALDSGIHLPTVLEVVKRLDNVDRLLEKRNGKVLKNEKTRVKEYCEKRKMTYTYSITGTDGPDHNKIFHASLTIADYPPFAGSGPSRAKAEMSAAGRCIVKLEADGKEI